MRIEHVALWTNNLDQMKDFYVEFFRGRSNDKYVNHKTGFESYFITFDSGARLEIMRMFPTSAGGDSDDVDMHQSGYAHIAISTGSRKNVDEMTNKLRTAGYRVVSAPRETGDGYYESCVLDPDGNRVEITE